jgi:hypothetical protein
MKNVLLNKKIIGHHDADRSSNLLWIYSACTYI